MWGGCDRVGHFTWSEVSTQSYFARCFYRCTKVLRVSPRNSGWTNSCIASYCQLLSQTFQTFQTFYIATPVTSIRGFGGPVKSQVGILCHPMDSIEVVLPSGQ